MKKTLSIVLSVLVMGIFSPASANTIKWSMPGDSLTLDPHAQNEGPTHMVSRQVYEGLVTPGINMEVLPQLAESWTTTADDTWIFNIRRGVTFHDGSSLTAGDVAFSINRAKTAPSDMVDLIKSVKSARAIDAHTVEVKTDGPNPILLNQLTQIFVMSEAWSKANGCEASYNWDAGETSYCASNANGTGPFEITFREQDVRTVFEKNNNWWGNHYKHNIDKIELLHKAESVIETSETRLAKEKIRKTEQKLQKKHLARLQRGLVESIETSNIHQETLRALKQVNTSFSMIGYPILTRSGELLKSRLA